MEVGGERGRIKSSRYEAYLEDSRMFTRRMEQKLDRRCIPTGHSDIGLVSCYGALGGVCERISW